MEMSNLGFCNSHGGKFVNCNMLDPMVGGAQLQVEKCQPGNVKYVTYYYVDKSLKARVGVTVYHVVTTGEEGAIIEYYNERADKIPYRKRTYRNYIKIPNKYYDIVKYIHPMLDKE